jgi:hypothetical protein
VIVTMKLSGRRGRVRSTVGRVAAFALAGGAGTVAAEETRAGGVLVVEREGVVADNFVATGGTVLIEGRVKGDLTAVAGTVVVDGTVTGHVAATAGSVAVDGSVILGEGATVAGEFKTAAGEVRVNGAVGGDAVSSGTPCWARCCWARRGFGRRVGSLIHDSSDDRPHALVYRDAVRDQLVERLFDCLSGDACPDSRAVVCGRVDRVKMTGDGGVISAVPGGHSDRRPGRVNRRITAPDRSCDSRETDASLVGTTRPTVAPETATSVDRSERPAVAGAHSLGSSTSSSTRAFSHWRRSSSSSSPSSEIS